MSMRRSPSIARLSNGAGSPRERPRLWRPESATANPDVRRVYSFVATWRSWLSPPHSRGSRRYARMGHALLLRSARSRSSSVPERHISDAFLFPCSPADSFVRARCGRATVLCSSRPRGPPRDCGRTAMRFDSRRWRGKPALRFEFFLFGRGTAGQEARCASDRWRAACAWDTKSGRFAAEAEVLTRSDRSRDELVRSGRKREGW